MRNIIFVISALIIITCSCRKKIPEDIIKPEKMQAVFWDYISADIFVVDFVSRDTNKNAALENIKLQNKIFSKHNISKEEFYKSYAYYVNHPTLMKTMIDSMLVKKEKKKHNLRTDQIFNKHE